MRHIDWHATNPAFCALMWALALMLLIVILAHAAAAHQPATHASLRTGGAMWRWVPTSRQ